MGMETSSDRRARYVDTVYETISECQRAGCMQLTFEDQALDGRTLTLRGKQVLHFGSCSYLGLELDERLKMGAMEAIRRYGTQFSSSRAYVGSRQYQELEGLLGQMCDASVLVAPSTTLAHYAAIPVLMRAGDALVLDHQVHASVRTTAELARAAGVTLVTIPHNRLDLLAEQVRTLSKTHRHVWYMLDGVYSMFGDLAPFSELKAMLDEHEQLHLYVDDAHGIGWTGRHGRGHALGHGPLHRKMIVAGSLNKSFAAAGGFLALSDPALSKVIFSSGGSFLFSGPVQPPMLGAAIASARIHLSEEGPALQDELRERIEYTNQAARRHGLPLIAESSSPIFYIGVGTPEVGKSMWQRMYDAGFYVNMGIFPAVPLDNTGVRFTVTRHLRLDDIEDMLAALAHELTGVLAAHGSSIEDVRRAFGLA